MCVHRFTALSPDPCEVPRPCSPSFPAPCWREGARLTAGGAPAQETECFLVSPEIGWGTQGPLWAFASASFSPPPLAVSASSGQPAPHPSLLLSLKTQASRLVIHLFCFVFLFLFCDFQEKEEEVAELILEAWPSIFIFIVCISTSVVLGFFYYRNVSVRLFEYFKTFIET